MFRRDVLVKRQDTVTPGLIWLIQVWSSGSHAAMENVQIADDHRGFVLATSGIRFVPWGFNYDRDENGRLLEDYWEHEWPKIVADFREMKGLGANIVRVHLQLGKFMKGLDQPDAHALDRLANLVTLAEQTGLYVDLTGLGCYRKRDVPAWYDTLAEPERWAVQARFWEAIASRCASSSAVFCYDLMNEPVVPGGRRQPGEWLGPPLGEFHYVQVITLDRKERPRPAIARTWVEALVKAIRRMDAGHLITVGLVDWSLDRPGSNCSANFSSAGVPHHLPIARARLSPPMIQNISKPRNASIESRRSGREATTDVEGGLCGSVMEAPNFLGFAGVSVSRGRALILTQRAPVQKVGTMFSASSHATGA